MNSGAVPPSHVRWHIVLLLLAISIVTYIDRVNISIAARQMMPALGLTDVQMGEIFSAFFLGYALFQIPGGWLGDRWGSKRVLTLALIWWSAFTALTAMAATLPTARAVGTLASLALVRFLIGMGESVALPNFNRTVANWLAPSERGLGIGLAIGGIGIGSALTPPVTAWLMVNFGWQSAFYLSAAVGLAVAGVWYVYATDRPEQHRAVNAEELRVIRGGASPDPDAARHDSWRSVARLPSLWWLCASYACFGYAGNLFMSWFYLYLVSERGFTDVGGAWLTSAPFLAMAASCPLGGWLSDRLAVRYGTTTGRRVVGASGMAVAAVAMMVGGAVSSPLAAVAWLSLGAGALYFGVGAYWSSTVDLARRYAGTVSGIMNTGANLGAVMAAVLTPWLAARLNWMAALAAAAFMALAGAVMWGRITPVAEER